jgi:hypothetical protein
MVVDLIKEMDLKEYNELTSNSVDINYYATYDGKVIVIGNPITYNVYTKAKTVLREKYVFVVSFDLNNDNFDDVQQIIQEYKKNRIIYDAHWCNEKCHLLHELNQNGYCFIYNQIVVIDCIENIKYEINRKKRYCDVVNVDGFKEMLINIEKQLPAYYEHFGIINEKDVFQAIKFIDNLEYLLLSDDEDLRKLFINYKNILKKFYN